MIITKEIAQQLELTPSQVLELNKLLAFINVKSIGELSSVSNPVKGYLPYEDGDGELKKININNFFQLIGGLAKPISPGDSAPTVVGWYKPRVYSADPGTNYPNLGNLKAVQGYDTLFYFNGSNWSDVKNKLNGIFVSEKFDPTTSTNAQGGKQIADHLDDYLGLVNANYQNVYLSKYSGLSDPELLNGSISSSFDLTPISNGDKTGWLEIPAGVTKILNFSFDVIVYFQFSNSTPTKLGGGITSSVNINIPNGSTRIYFTVKSGGLNQDLVKNYISFENNHLVPSYGDNPYVRKKDIKILAEKPIDQISNIKLNTVASDFNSANLLNGYIAQSGSFTPSNNGDKTIQIDIPNGAKYMIFNISTVVYYQISDDTPVKLSNGVTIIDQSIDLPIGSTRLYFTVKYSVFKVDFLKDSVIFGFKDREYLIKNTQFAEVLKDNFLGQIMLGSKQYTFVGDQFRIYQENVFSGFKPRENFNIEFKGDAVLGSDGDKGRYCDVLNSGELTVCVYDLNRNLIAEKKAIVYKKNKATVINQTFNSNNKLQVLFIGDSLFHNNQNEIGKEWLRMLNTNVSDEQITEGVVYPPTYNLGAGNIELVGNLGGSLNKYEIGNSLTVLMAGKNGPGTSNNPFYNPNSSNPDEVDSEGWNKRVDIARYIQNVCGVGKYPKFIYMACGVNDIVELGWDITRLPLVRNRLKAVLLKIKQACDNVAAGNSNVRILLVNHQFYPLNEGHTFNSTFEPSLQRHIWAKHYTEYEKLVMEDSTLNTFVRFVDGASSFDLDFGYDYANARVNPRNSQLQNYIVDTVHMGNNGACMYADALLRDFLYNECS